MDCKTVKEILGEFVDKELDEEKESQVKEHLLDCSDCRRELNTILSIDNALRSLASKKAKPSFDFIRKIPEQLKQSFKVFFDKIYPQETDVAEFKCFTLTIFDGKDRRKKNSQRYLKWHERFEEDMLISARNLTHNDDEAWDLYLDAYKQALKNEDSFNPKSPFEPWFYTIMKNKWYKKVKENMEKEIPTLSIDSFFGEDGIDIPDTEDIEVKIEEDLIEKVRESVEELVPELRYPIISYYYYYNMSYEEAAKEIGISLNEFKALMKRAKRALAKKLKNKIV